MTENEIGQLVRNSMYEVYFELGPGLLESTYEFALKFELESLGLKVKSQVDLPLTYKGNILDKAYRIDLLIEDKVVIEIKSVEALTKVHHKQLIGYLKLASLKLGMLVNFNTDYLNPNIIRKVNNLKSFKNTMRSSRPLRDNYAVATAGSGLPKSYKKEKCEATAPTNVLLSR